MTTTAIRDDASLCAGHPPASRPRVAAQHFDIVPFDAPLGAEVVGLDLSQPLDAGGFARIHRAHLDHHVLVFRDQRITPDEHIAFSRRFGPLQIHVLHQFALAGHPEVLIVSNVVENGKPIGNRRRGPFLALRPVVQGEAEPRLAAACAGTAGRRRRHAVREHASRVGHAAGPSAPRGRSGAPSIRISHAMRSCRRAIRGGRTCRPSRSRRLPRSCIRSCARIRKRAARRCSSASISRRASSGCPTTKAARCSTSCSRRACRACTGTHGASTISCSGTTVR